MLHVERKKIFYKKCRVCSPTRYTRTNKLVPTGFSKVMAKRSLFKMKGFLKQFKINVNSKLKYNFKMLYVKRKK